MKFDCCREFRRGGEQIHLKGGRGGGEERKNRRGRRISRRTTMRCRNPRRKKRIRPHGGRRGGGGSQKRHPGGARRRWFPQYRFEGLLHRRRPPSGTTSSPIAPLFRRLRFVLHGHFGQLRNDVELGVSAIRGLRWSVGGEKGRGERKGGGRWRGGVDAAPSASRWTAPPDRRRDRIPIRGRNERDGENDGGVASA